MSALFEHTEKLDTENCDQIKCRYCYDSSRPLLSVCGCLGTIAYVHEDCVLDWITKKIQNADRVEIPACQICNQTFSARMKVGSRRLCLSLLLDKVSNLQAHEKASFIVHSLMMIVAILVICHFMLNVLGGEVLSSSVGTVLTNVFTQFIAQIYVIFCFREIVRDKRWLISQSMVQIVEVTLKPRLTIKK